MKNRAWMQIALVCAGGLGAAAAPSCGGSEFVVAGGTGGDTPSSSRGTGGDTSSSSSTGTPGGEICGNGKDDNDDGISDCADPDCSATFECVDPLPMEDGWTGPLSIWVDAPGEATPCSPAWETSEVSDKVGKPSDPQIGCSCTCETSSVCSASLSTFPTPVCGNPGGTVLADGVCKAVSLTVGSTLSNALQPAGCKSKLVPNKPEPTWGGGEALVCSGSKAVGCSNGKVCVEKPTDTSKQQICITHVGDVACPNTYSKKSVSYGSFLDTRGCTQCNCGPVQGADCDGKVHLFDGDACGGADAQSSITNGMCASDSVISQIGSVKYTANNHGSCPSIGGNPIGMVTPKEPLTVCCR